MTSLRLRSTPRLVCSQSLYVALNVRSAFSDCAIGRLAASEPARQVSQAFVVPLLAVAGYDFRGASPPGASKLGIIPSRKGTLAIPFPCVYGRC